MTRQHLFSVTKKDFEVQTLKGSGPGGQHRNKTETGVRIVHRPSGAVGVATDNKSQAVNKEAAFNRLANSKTFKGWIKIKAFKMMGEKSIEERVEEAMHPKNLSWEVKDETGKWVPMEAPGEERTNDTESA